MPQLSGRPAGTISRAFFFLPGVEETLGLRHGLAEDGCSESQVILAKTLLTQCRSSSSAFYAQLAVHWLIEAAKRGHEEAYDFLKDCETTGIGINIKNRADVQFCLNFCDNERLARKIASRFLRPIMSDTEESIPAAVLQKEVKHVLSGEEKKVEEFGDFAPFVDSEPMLLEKATFFESSESHVSFSEVVSSIQTCLEGNLPLLTLKQVVQFQGYKKWFTGKYVCYLMKFLQKSLEDLICNLASLILLFSVFFMCLFSYGTSFFAGSNLIIVSHQCRLICVTLLCLLTMISLTYYVLKLQFGESNVKNWLNLIKYFEPSVKRENIEQKYLTRITFPCLAFLIISVCYILLFPLNPFKFIFNDLGILSIIFMILSDRAIRLERSRVNVSFVLNFCLCLYKANFFEHITFGLPDYFAFNISYNFGKHWGIQLNLISLLIMLLSLPFLYVKMALGMGVVFLPHLMSLVWMNLACMHISKISNLDLFYSVVFLLAVMIISRIIGVHLSFILGVLIKLLYFSDNLSLKIILSLFSLVLLIYAINLFINVKIKVFHNDIACYIFICTIILCMSCEVVSPKMQPTTDSNEVLPWNKYQTHCHYDAWYNQNPAEVQISCLPLKGKKVSAEGTITTIDITEVHNSMQSFSNVLPYPLNSWFSQVFGEPLAHCENDLMTAEKQSCKLYNSLNLNGNYLHNWNEYKYRIALELSSRSSPEIILIVNHLFSPFVRSLREGDLLRVTGTLDSNIGSSSPQFLLDEAKCVTCGSDVVCGSTNIIMPPINFDLSIQNFINFYLYPLFYYVPNAIIA